MTNTKQTKAQTTPRNFRAVDFGSPSMRIKDLTAGIARRRRQIAKLQREITNAERFIQQELNTR